MRNKSHINEKESSMEELLTYLIDSAKECLDSDRFEVYQSFDESYMIMKFPTVFLKIKGHDLSPLLKSFSESTYVFFDEPFGELAPSAPSTVIYFNKNKILNYAKKTDVKKTMKRAFNEKE